MTRRKASAAAAVEPVPVVPVANKGAGLRLVALVGYKLALVAVAVVRIVFHYYCKMFADIAHESYLIFTDGPPQRATDQTNEKGTE